jgi:phosphatidylglycerophosphate synthase
MNDRMSRLWATKTKDDEWWSSFVTAPMAILVNYVVVDFRWLTPNLITLLSFVTAIVSVVVIVVGETTGFVIAAVLIQLSHVLDCMDGQMARYRKTTSASGSYFDKATDQIQVALWFGAVGYVAYDLSADVLPILLAFIGVAFYSLRGYTKYVAIHVEMSRDSHYLALIAEQGAAEKQAEESSTGFDLRAKIKWFIREQRKIIRFDEGVLIFMLSLALVLDALTPMLWVFAASQVSLGLFRSWQRGQEIELDRQMRIEK